MGVFTQADQALEWRGGQEIVRIEPWGAGQPPGARDGVGDDPR